MTDSTIDTQTGDAGFDVGSSTDLFAEIESETELGDDTRAETDDGDDSDIVDEQTAADIFDQLRTDIGDEVGADAILADESPDDIIASADEPGPDPDATVDADLLADDDELADLLRTGRSTDDDGEFLWIEPDADDDSETDADERATGGSASSDTDVAPAADNEAPTDDAAAASALDAVDAPADDTQAESSPSTPDTASDDSSEGRSPSSDDTVEEKTTDTVEDEDGEADEAEPVAADTAVEPEATAATSEPDAGDDVESESDHTDDAAGPLSKLRKLVGGLL